MDDFANPFAIPLVWEETSITLYEDDTRFELEDLSSGQWQSKSPLLEDFNSKENQLDLHYKRLRLADLDADFLDDSLCHPLEDFGDLSSFTSSFDDEEREDIEDASNYIWTPPEAAPGKHTIKPRNGEADPLLAGLVQLVLGRESMIFRFNDKTQCFESHLDSMRRLGYSSQTFDDLTKGVINFAGRLRNVRNFAHRVYTPSQCSRSLIAVAEHVSRNVLSLQAKLYQASRQISSVFELRELILEPNLLLTCLSNLIAQTRDVKSDEQILSILYRFAQDPNHSTPIRLHLLALLRNAAAPWMSDWGRWLGLCPYEVGHHNCNLPNFANGLAADVDGDVRINSDFDFGEESLPAFINPTEGETMFEVGQGLQLLRAHQPKHPVVHAKMASHEAPKLDFQISWNDVERIETKAKAYEANLLAAIKSFDLGSSIEIPNTITNAQANSVSDDAYLTPNDRPNKYLKVLNAKIESPLPSLLLDNEIDPMAEDPDLIPLDIGPPISQIPSLSLNPIISTQAHLINQSILRLLFKDHEIRSHFSLLYRYQLLGDGFFASQLSQTLFEHGLPSADLSLQADAFGLRPGSRAIWPPVSSEHRLALMGVLSESYHTSNPNTSKNSADLPGGLSFAIRAMSDTDVEKSMNPNSVSASDFLQMQYRPPPPLETIISPRSLEKYDTIFRLLLRLKRMLHAVTHLTRSAKHPPPNSLAQRFKFEANHFVYCVCSYLFGNVTSIWNAFAEKIEALEIRVEKYEIGEDDSPKSLRAMHEGMLDKMMFALLLDKGQETIMGLLENVFETVLLFARTERSDERLRNDCQQLRQRIGDFVALCKEFSQGRVHWVSGDPDMREVEYGGLERLLVMLDMNGNFARINDETRVVSDE